MVVLRAAQWNLKSLSMLDLYRWVARIECGIHRSGCTSRALALIRYLIVATSIISATIRRKRQLWALLWWKKKNQRLSWSRHSSRITSDTSAIIVETNRRNEEPDFRSSKRKIQMLRESTHCTSWDWKVNVATIWLRNFSDVLILLFILSLAIKYPVINQQTIWR